MPCEREGPEACCQAHRPNILAAVSPDSSQQGWLAGVPSEREYLAAYCQARGVPLPDPVVWAFFLALSLFRAAAILAGVGARARLGNASSARAGAVRLG